MRTFIYKRTHKGDPDIQGWFGNEDCMGRLRSCDFDAVIGIGGICDLAISEGISQKLNWIGVGAIRQCNYKRGPLITFRHFKLFEEDGEDFYSIAPALALRLLNAKASRFLFNDGFNADEQAEVDRILNRAKNAPPSAETCELRERKNGHCPARICGTQSVSFLGLPPPRILRRAASCLK